MILQVSNRVCEFPLLLIILLDYSARIPLFFFLPRSWRPCRPRAGSGRCCGARSVLPGEAGCAGDSGRSWGWGECLSACTPPVHKRILSDSAPLFARSLHFRSCCSTFIWQEAVEHFDCAFNNSAKQVSSSFTVYSYVCTSSKLLLCWLQVSAAVASAAGISLHYNADRESEKKWIIHPRTDKPGCLTAITRCLTSGILFQHQEGLQHVYFVMVGLDLFLIPKVYLCPIYCSYVIFTAHTDWTLVLPASQCIYQDQSKKVPLPHHNSQSDPLNDAGTLWGLTVCLLSRFLDWPPAVHTAQPGPKVSPAGCFSWWGRSARGAAQKPHQSVHTGRHSEALSPSRGSVEE